MAEDREARLAPDVPGVGEGQRLGAEPLDGFLARTPRLAVAFSGGCDSAYLLAAARAAGCAVRAYRVDTAFQPAFERDDAERVAAALGVPLTTIALDVLAHADVAANPPDRCYRCKGLIFDAIRAQETRYEIGQQVQSEIILCSFGKFLETIKNCSVLINVVESYILSGFKKFQKL